MNTERGLSSEKKMHASAWDHTGTPPAAKLLSLVWSVAWHTSSYTEGGPCQERELCRILVSRNALLVELPPPPPCLFSSFSCFLLPFIQEGQKPALFSASSYWSSIHINNFSDSIMYTRACSNVPHSKSNWLLRTYVELLLSHHHLKRRKAGPILLPACYSS